MPISTVIFDFDGTLASSLEGIHACFQEALARFGYARPSVDAVRLTVGLPLEESVRILTKNRCDGAQLESVVDNYRALYKQKGRAMASLFPGAKDALTALRQMGVRIVLVSNKSHRGLCRLAEHLGIGPDVDAMHGVQDGSFRKPDARLYTETLAPLLPEPRGSRVLMVGDTESDLLFANNAGLRPCWASYGYGDQAVCRALEPEFILPDVSQLPGLVHSLDSSE